MKILRPISGAAGIFFPTGLPPDGTCEFGTKQCLELCIPHKKQTVSLKTTKRIYKFFTEEPTIKVCLKIVEEMTQMQINILHWFMSGDCLIRDQDKLIKIVETLWKNTQIVQNGFTRNVKFWNAINHRSNIVVTSESKSDIPSRYNLGKIFGVPNYESGVVDLYIANKSKGATRYGGCGAKFVDYNYSGEKVEDTHPVNCAECLKAKRGCFYKQSIRKGEKW